MIKRVINSFLVRGQVVQVRLWAQGLTIGVVIAAAALTHAQRAQAMEMRKVRHAMAVEYLNQPHHLLWRSA